MNEEAASSPITARVVPEGQSASILPRYVGARLMMLCEGAIFDSMRELSADYEGGSWTFLELVVATGFYMRLGKDRGEIAMSSENGYSCALSNDAAGIVATLFGLNKVAARYADEKVIDAYHELLDFAKGHPEREHILGLID